MELIDLNFQLQIDVALPKRDHFHFLPFFRVFRFIFFSNEYGREISMSIRCDNCGQENFLNLLSESRNFCLITRNRRCDEEWKNNFIYKRTQADSTEYGNRRYKFGDTLRGAASISNIQVFQIYSYRIFFSMN